MPRQPIVSSALAQPSGHFSQGIIVEARGRLVFISGMVARRADGSIAAVEAAGGTLADICRVDVHVRNMEHFPTIHRVRRHYFPDPPPASTMVEVSKFTHPDYLIEMSAIAVLP
jgi:2-iminobutanoate/2-iminopropanoate deaminase